MVSDKDAASNEQLTETAEVRIDRRGRLYIKGQDLLNSKAFRARLDEMAQLATDYPSKRQSRSSR